MNLTNIIKIGAISQTFASVLILGTFIDLKVVSAQPTILGDQKSDLNTESNSSTLSEKLAQDKNEQKILRRITVSGGSELVDQVPGSAFYLGKEQLDQGNAGLDDVNRVLRQVPGVNLTEEDGYGLRPNIGFRGTDTDRSSSITLMEDGVLISPAPYSAPAAYYFPAIGRMEGVEIIKGAGQIKYGPQTTGGSLNLLSTSIPSEFRAHGDFGFGEDNNRLGHFYIGDNYKHGGFLLETYQAGSDGFKQLDGGGDTGFDIQDYVGKFKINSDRNADLYQELEFKIGNYNQHADETYLGLSDQDFDKNPYRRYAASQLDNIDVDHEQYQLRHYAELGSGIDLITTAYYNRTKRNWEKLESVGGGSIASILDDPSQHQDQFSWIQGADSPDDALSIRSNNRKYLSRGIQSALGVDFETDQVSHQAEFGVRYHTDYEDRFQHEDSYRMLNGTMVRTGQGAPGSNANRKGEADAWAFYAQDTLALNAWKVTPGLRYELIDYQRKDWGKTDPDRTGVALTGNSTQVDALIPGLGVRYEFSDELGAFSGIHKGFAPPGPQSSNLVDEEESINYEIGADFKRASLKSEAIVFMNDYDNLLGADTESSGGTGSGDLFNAGEATTWGVELSTAYDLVEGLEQAYRLPVRFAYTYTDAEFDSSFQSGFFGDVSDGDPIPYVAEQQLSASIGVEWDRYALYLNSFYVDSMPTAPGSSGSSNSLRTDSHVIFDLIAEVAANEGVKVYASLENLFDEEYVVARRPAGARPGRPMTFLAGIKFDL